MAHLLIDVSDVRRTAILSVLHAMEDMEDPASLDPEEWTDPAVESWARVIASAVSELERQIEKAHV
jgi:hypothetical protein